MKAHLLNSITAVYAPGTVLHYEVREPGKRARWVLVVYHEAVANVYPASKGGKMLEPPVAIAGGDITMTPGTLLHLAGFEMEGG